MLSRNIDLTENRDFSSDSPIAVLPNPVAGRKRNETMTSEQYDSLRKWVHIFGKTWHHDQSEEIFGIPKWNEEQEEELPAHTYPWTRWEIYLRIPWRHNNTGTRREDDRGWNLFRLR